MNVRFLLILLLVAAAPVWAQPAVAPNAAAPRSSPDQFRPTGERAEALPGATIRDKPTPDGPAVLVLGGGGPVELISRIENGSGSWWYIRSEGLHGWLDERELQRSR